MTPKTKHYAASRTAKHIQFCQDSVAILKLDMLNLQPIMAYLPTNTTLEMSMMMMMITIKLITCFKYHTIPMYGKSELLVFVVNDHSQFQILDTLLTGRRAPNPC